MDQLDVLRIIITLSLLIILAGCSGARFHTNITKDILADQVSTRVARGDLQQFYSDQEAHESGAKLLGRVEGQFCINKNHDTKPNISYNRAKSHAIDALKNDTMNRGGNAFTINSCSETSVSYCDLSVLCTGQAYDY
ncbi:hypothetical protein P20495_2995 [Pseudoalteromonas sp. BSi20495]|nr:hypothetical protein [Pseudoalteromonas sp. BSi20495]GAA80480.1 hypothetical protein P20495_2995 [Pseudoalteromonas sp. BSi20495]